MRLFSAGDLLHHQIPSQYSGGYITVVQNNWNFSSLEAATRGVLLEKDILKNFTKFIEKHLCQSLRPATLLKKEDSGTGVSRELSEIFKNNFF